MIERIKRNRLVSALIVGSVVFSLLALFVFPFVRSTQPTGSPMDRFYFFQLIQSIGERVPGIVYELRIFLSVALGGYLVAAIMLLARGLGFVFKGSALLFWTGWVAGVAAFGFAHIGLNHLISNNAEFGLAWFLGYAVYGFGFVLFFATRRSRAALAG